MDSDDYVSKYPHSFRLKRGLMKLNRNLITYALEFNDKKDIWLFAKINNRRICKSIISSKTFDNRQFFNNPKGLQFNQYIADYDGGSLSNMIESFTNSQNKLIVAYPTTTYSIILKDLMTTEVISTLKGHIAPIKCLRYMHDNSGEYLISSSLDNSVIVWDTETSTQCIRIANLYNSVAYIFSCLLININFSKYIITSALSNDFMRVFDFNGNSLGEIGTRDFTIFIDLWYDQLQKEHYIINCNKHNVKLYNWRTKELEKVFQKTDCFHHSAIVINKGDRQELIASAATGDICIWDLQSQLLLGCVRVGNNLKGLIYWNNNYIVATNQEQIKIIDLNNQIVIKSIVRKNEQIGTILKVKHSLYGESLISGERHHIFLWKEHGALTSST